MSNRDGEERKVKLEGFDLGGERMALVGKALRFGSLAIGVLLVAASLSVRGQGVPGNIQDPSLPSPNGSSLVKPDAPYVATPESVVIEMLKLAGVSQNDVVYNLGSGDGRLVIAAVQKFGAKRGVGVELDPTLVSTSKANAQKAGVSDRVEFLQQNLFDTNFRQASVVTLYLSPDANLKLRPRLLKELRPGSRIVSHAFAMGDWVPDKSITVPASPNRKLYQWTVPANLAGDWQGNIEYAPGRRQAYTLRFTQQFQKVKGNVIVNGEAYTIPKITLTGDRLSFSRTENIEGQTMTAQFNGRIEGDTLKGVAELEAGIFSRKLPITVKRQGEQLSQKEGGK